MERVLCALDVEQPVLSAISLAGLIAERFGVPLEVLHVEGTSNAGPFQTNADRVQELMASHNAGQLLKRLVEGQGRPESTTTKLTSGATVASILERSAANGNDLIVLGARQRSDLGWQFRNDVARQVSALAACATLTVHEREGRDEIERILVPVDLGPVTARAIAWASALARRFEAQVHVLHVVSRERHTQRTVDRSKKVKRSSLVPSDLSARVAELAAELARSDVRASHEVSIAGSVVNGITDCNDRGEFDLLVVGMNGPPQGASRLTRDVPSALRGRMSIPVLSVREISADSPDSASGAGSR